MTVIAARISSIYIYISFIDKYITHKLNGLANQTTNYYGRQRFFPDNVSIRETILKEFTDVIINKLHFNNLRLVAKEQCRHFSYEAKLKEREEVWHCLKTNF